VGVEIIGRLVVQYDNEVRLLYYVVMFRFQVKFEAPNWPCNELGNPETTLYW